MVQNPAKRRRRIEWQTKMRQGRQRKNIWIDPANKIFIFSGLRGSKTIKIPVFNGLRPESRQQRSYGRRTGRSYRPGLRARCSGLNALDAMLRAGCLPATGSIVRRMGEMIGKSRRKKLRRIGRRAGAAMPSRLTAAAANRLASGVRGANCRGSDRSRRGGKAE